MEENKSNNIEEEIDFEKIAKSPVRWFGIVYPYFLLLIIVAGLFYVANINTIHENEIKPTIDDSSRFKQELVQKSAIALAGVDINVISQSTSELISQGRDLYMANCASCHGNEGKGDGVAGAGINPPPKNFADPSNWKNDASIAGMFKTLEEGIDGTAMVAYEYLPIDSRFAMIHFVHSLMGDYPKNTTEELNELSDRYQLAESRVVPYQIPVSKSMQLLFDENGENINLAFVLSDIIHIHKNNIGYDLFNKVTSDNKRALYYLLQSKKWLSSNSEFIAYVQPTIPENGFAAGFNKLSENEISRLREFLSGFYQKPTEARK